MLLYSVSLIHLGTHIKNTLISCFYRNDRAIRSHSALLLCYCVPPSLWSCYRSICSCLYLTVSKYQRNKSSEIDSPEKSDGIPQVQAFVSIHSILLIRVRMETTVDLRGKVTGLLISVAVVNQHEQLPEILCYHQEGDQ